jgi:paraquat-inducible protein B
MCVRENVNQTPAAGREELLRPTACNSVGRTRRLACFALTVLWLVVACAKAPYDGQQAAEKAVQEARNVGAPIYLPQEFSALEAKLETAKEEISTQYKLSEFRRDYSRANSLLTETQVEGNMIIAEAQKRKQDAKAAALQEKEQAEEAVHEVREIVERAEKTPASPLGKVSDELKAEAGELNRTLAEVETAIEADNHLVAKNNAKAVQEKIHKLQGEVQGQAKSLAPDQRN